MRCGPLVDNSGWRTKTISAPFCPNWFLVYVNTLMIQQILGRPDWQNRLEIEDLRALSPLIYAHVNPYGRFELDMNTRLRLD